MTLVSEEIAEKRRRICEDAKCSAISSLDFADACAECPNGHWRHYFCFEKSGLGTRIESIAGPIARGIDALAGTHIATCGGCKKMKDRLNAGMSMAEALKLRLKGL